MVLGALGADHSVGDVGGVIALVVALWMSFKIPRRSVPRNPRRATVRRMAWREHQELADQDDTIRREEQEGKRPIPQARWSNRR